MRFVFLTFKLVFVAVLAIALFVGVQVYFAYQAMTSPSAVAAPLTRIDAAQLPGAISDAQRKLDTQVANKQAFSLELSGTDLMALLTAQAGDRPLPVTNASIDIATGGIAFTADVRGAVPVPVSGNLTPSLEAGKLKLAPSGMRIGSLPVPADQLVGPVIDQALDVNDGLAASGALALQAVELRDGKLHLVGLQRAGEPIEKDVARRIAEQANTPAGAAREISVPGADLVPAGNSLNKAGQPMYIALGDSLTAGDGVTDRRQAFVSRFHGFLEKRSGQTWGLTNLGVSGESTASMLNGGQLDKAIALVRQDSSRVRVVTLGIGANDLLGHLGSAVCQSDPTGADCQGRLQAGLSAFPANFTLIADRLQAALDPSTEVVVVNAYNPFDFGIGIPAEQQANRTVQALNESMQRLATARGWRVADARSAIGDRAAALTGILDGDVHPNALGYQAMAFAVTKALR
jgi:lysophospholipase L1-like esterase